MNTFPATPLPNSFSEKTIKKVYRTNLEAGGYIKTKPIYTEKKKQFTIKWLGLTSAEKSILDDFFDNNQGIAFTWVHPDTDASYTCIFTIDELEFTWVPKNSWTTSMTFQEQ